MVQIFAEVKSMFQKYWLILRQFRNFSNKHDIDNCN